MNDPRYPESSAYHEAGHIAIAAAQGMRLSRHGIRLDSEGRGISFYEYRKPRRFSSAPSEVKWEHTVVATLAGLIAQQKFYPECSVLGASGDNDLVDMLVMERDEDDPFGDAWFTAQVELRRESESMVKAHWPTIEAVAQALWKMPETPRDFHEPDHGWSQSLVEKKLDGAAVVDILRRFGLPASIWDIQEVAD